MTELQKEKQGRLGATPLIHPIRRQLEWQHSTLHVWSHSDFLLQNFTSKLSGNKSKLQIKSIFECKTLHYIFTWYKITVLSRLRSNQWCILDIYVHSFKFQLVLLLTWKHLRTLFQLSIKVCSGPWKQQLRPQGPFSSCSTAFNLITWSL